MEPKQYKTKFGNKDLIIEIGKLAGQANGAVTVRYGDTLILATAVMAKEPREEVDYMPLMVDYEEKLYAAGKIKGSRWVKREGRPSDEAILTGRLVDRCLRPLFDERIRNDIQIIITVFSIDEDNDPDIPAIIGASLALGISNIPWDGPIGACRIAIINKQMILNASYNCRQKADLDLVIAGPKNQINMLEGEAKEAKEEHVIRAIEVGSKYVQKIIDFQEEVIKDINPVKLEPELQDLSIDPEKPEKLVKNGKRADGRGLSDIRPISAEVGLLPRTHGSGLFTRGQTQVLSIVTLGPPSDEQFLETMETEGRKRFMHHYNFPPYSVQEVAPLRGPGRREIGHGALAERALMYVIPDKEKFLYTIRVVSEVLSSNGSSSMASVCASTLALMDAGVPIKKPVAGIALGLSEDKKTILTDIQGPEDHYGLMDFKIAGTDSGITALQMDVKTVGVELELLQKAFVQSKKARLEILHEMQKVIASPRQELSSFAPRIYTIQIPPKNIGDIIGKGGKTIREITENTGVDIDIQDDGTTIITSEKAEEAQRAINWIQKIIQEANDFARRKTSYRA
ncbi:MAG: polyribonucleotide nucleotidyltransferase [bacterium]